MRGRILVIVAFAIMMFAVSVGAEVVAPVSSAPKPVPPLFYEKAIELQYVTDVRFNDVGYQKPYGAVLGKFGMDLSNTFYAIKEVPGKVTFYLEPTVGAASSGQDYEFGLGVGLQYTYPVTSWLSPFVSISAGPHYVSLYTQQEKYSSGICLQLMGTLGVYLKTAEDQAISLAYQPFVHCSNGRLQYYVYQYNNTCAEVGYSWFFK